MVTLCSASRLAISLAVSLNLCAAWAADYPEWLAQVPGSPSEPDPDGDGYDTFTEYALGAEPAHALDPTLHGSAPYVALPAGQLALALDYPGRRDVVYIVETCTALTGEANSWEGLAWKAGNAPWLPLMEPARVTQIDHSLLFHFADDPQSQRFYRLRIETHPSLQTLPQAVRFLRQATFGPTMAEAQALAAADLDFESWIDAQMNLPATSHLALVDAHPSRFPTGLRHAKGIAWFHAALLGEDQLRQRAAWALSQIMVVGENGSKQANEPRQWARFYDIFVEHAFGSYRDLLGAVTRSPKMGDFLTYVNNRKATATTQPDENYAREVMQLFTIGLWQLNRDGTLQTDAQGEPIPTYDNSDIVEMARVFTGLVYAPREPGAEFPNRFDDLVARPFRHDTEAKRMPDGVILPAGQDTYQDIDAALDWLCDHPNTAPFVSFRLIQRLTLSNPSPGYIDRVAAIFEDDGQGSRGNLAAVVRAILLDPEARSGAFLVDPTRGKLREPLIRFTSLCRGFHLSSSRPDGLLLITALENHFGQFPYRSPSVFNFYSPFFAPQGEIASSRLVAPEFQILDDSIGLKTFAVFKTLIEEGLMQPIGNSSRSQGQLDLGDLATLAEDPAALVDHLDLLLANRTLTAEQRDAIASAVADLPQDSPTERARRALLLVSLSPAFAVLQ